MKSTTRNDKMYNLAQGIIAKGKIAFATGKMKSTTRNDKMYNLAQGIIAKGKMQCSIKRNDISHLTLSIKQ